MRYLLMICAEEWSPATDRGIPESVAWACEMERRGVLRAREGLRPSSDATTVRVRDGEVLLGDGPFAETKDRIGGFSVIECADLDEAIEVAAGHPAAKDGQIEVRPVLEP